MSSELVRPAKTRLGGRIATDKSQKNSSIAGAKQGLANKADISTARDGLAKLVLTIVHLLLEIMERQAYRRVSSGDLTEQETERLGNAIMQIRSKFQSLCEQFGFQSEELNLEIEKMFKPANEGNNPSHIGAPSDEQEMQRASIIDIVDRIIEKETTISGQVRISMAGIDLVVLNLLAMLQPVRGRSQK